MTIVITGPESTGKTTLAEALTEALGGLCIPEFARYYLTHFNQPYVRADLQTIGRGQRAWEDWGRARHPAHLVLDTDWMVLHIWETYRFVQQSVDWPLPSTDNLAWRKGYGAPQMPDLYLLCAPDFLWQPDPLREHPAEQWRLYRWYEQLLHQTGILFIALEGPHGVRLEKALRCIQSKID